MLDKIPKELFDLKDEKYRQFAATLCQSKYPMIGVRIPLLRQYAKKLHNPQFKDEYFEEVMVHGFYLAKLKIDFMEHTKIIEDFLPLIDNWSICDSFVSSLKFLKKHLNEYYPYLEKYLNSNQEYYQRYALVVLLNYYVKDANYLNNIFQILLKTPYNGYYALMAGSWLLSYCFIYHFEKSLDFVSQNKINNFIYHQGLTKALESLRINQNNKNKLRTLL